MKTIKEYEELRESNQEQYAKECLSHLNLLSKEIYIEEYKEGYKENEEEIYIVIGNEEIIIDKMDYSVKSTFGSYNFINDVIEVLESMIDGTY